MCHIVISKGRNYTAYIALLKGFAEELSLFSDPSLRHKSGWHASGVDDVHVDCMLKEIVDIDIFMGGQKRSKGR
jgi:hypothetical protein